MSRFPKSSLGAIVFLALSFVATGCESSSTGDDAAAQRSSRNGVEATIPAGWHRVPLAGLPGAVAPLEIASFKVDGAVGSICNPHRIVSQIPPGGALLQILQDSGVKRHGPGAVSQTGDPSRYPPLPRPFHLKEPQRFECGEAYNIFFHRGGRVFQLRIWTTSTGLSPAVRTQIERLADGLRVEAPRPLVVSYGPYVGIHCQQANSVRCDGIGLDVVLKKKATGVTASIAGRTLPMTTPGLHDVRARGRDWIGCMNHAGTNQKGSPLYIGENALAKGWAGDPAVHIPIRLKVTYGDGRWTARTFPRVVLRPGFG
jgi:uncharacterized protein YjhX (UPF0386 family)